MLHEEIWSCLSVKCETYNTFYILISKRNLQWDTINESKFRDIKTN